MVSHCCCMIGSWHECILKTRKKNKQHAFNFPSLLPVFVLNLALFVCPRVVFVVYLLCLDDCLVECCFHPFVRLSFWVVFQVVFFSIAITWSVRPSVCLVASIFLFYSFRSWWTTTVPNCCLSANHPPPRVLHLFFHHIKFHSIICQTSISWPVSLYSSFHYLI